MTASTKPRSDRGESVEQGGSTESVSSTKSVESTAQRKPLRPFWRSTVLYTIVIVAFFDIVLSYLYFSFYKAHQQAVTVEQKESQHLNEMRKAIAALTEKPKVVLLGSSVMAMPFFLLDQKQSGDKNADYFTRKFDITSLDKAFFHGRKNAVIGLGTDAAMVPDSYFLTHKFLVTEHKPEWIVLGLAPRDFSDTGPLRPSDSYQFQGLSELSDLPWTSQSYLTDFNDASGYIASHLSFFYGQRSPLQDRANDQYLKVVSRVVPSNSTQSAAAPEESFSETDRNKRWSSSLKEYRRHYRDLDPGRIQTSFAYLDRLFHLCKNENIRLLVVNMPLSADNQKMLPPGFYTDFRNHLKQCTTAGGVKFIDASEQNFTRGEFSDTAHLNEIGAVKLEKLIGSVIQPPG